MDTKHISIESEQAVLGSIIINNKQLFKAKNYGLEKEHFADSVHQEIFAKMEKVCYNELTFDPITVKGWFNNLEKECGDDYLIKLATSNSSGININGYCKLIIENYKKRQMDFAIAEYNLSAETKDVGASKDKLLKALIDIDLDKKNSNKSITEFIEPVMRGAEDFVKGNRGIRTGYRELDNMLMGLRKGEICFVGARAGMGKSAFALNLAYNNVINKKKVLMFSMEMTGIEILQRLTSLHSETGLGTILEPTEHNIETVFKKVKNTSSLETFYVNDNSRMNVNDIRLHTMKQMKITGLDLIIVDYVGLVQKDKSIQSVSYQIESIIQSLRAMAKDFKIPIIILAQINRDAEKKASKIPTMAELKDSGSIEQEANSVLLLYREKYYEDNKKEEKVKFGKNKTATEKAIEPKDKTDWLDVIVAKNRKGRRGTTTLQFIGSQQRVIEKIGDKK